MNRDFRVELLGLNDTEKTVTCQSDHAGQSCTHVHILRNYYTMQRGASPTVSQHCEAMF